MDVCLTGDNSLRGCGTCLNGDGSFTGDVAGTDAC